MRIAVCVKQVPDIESPISVDATSNGVDYTGLTLVCNPNDLHAVEEAVRLKEQDSTTEIIVVSVSPPHVKGETPLRTCLAMGADRAIHVRDDTEEVDPLRTSTLVASAIAKLDADLVLLGRNTVDQDSAATGPQVAEQLGVPFVTGIHALECVEGSLVRVHRQTERGEETFESPLPAVLTCHKGLNTPRRTSPIHIIKAKKKPIENWTLDELAVSPTAATRVVRLERPPSRQSCQHLEGSPGDVVDELVRLLHEKAKVL